MGGGIAAWWGRRQNRTRPTRGAFALITSAEGKRHRPEPRPGRVDRKPPPVAEALGYDNKHGRPRP